MYIIRADGNDGVMLKGKTCIAFIAEVTAEREHGVTPLTIHTTDTSGLLFLYKS